PCVNRCRLQLGRNRSRPFSGSNATPANRGTKNHQCTESPSPRRSCVSRVHWFNRRVSSIGPSITPLLTALFPVSAESRHEAYRGLRHVLVGAQRNFCRQQGENNGSDSNGSLQ